MGTLGSVVGGAIGTAVAPGLGTKIGATLGSKGEDLLKKTKGKLKDGAKKFSSQDTETKQGVVSSTLGLLQNIKANKLKKQADSAMPEFVDPGQAAFLAELNQKRKSIDTGADFAAGMNAIDTTNSGTNDAIVRASGGDSSGTIQSLLQSERVANDSKNNVLAQGQQQQAQYTSMFANQLNDISQRKMELQLLRSQQARGEWAKMKQHSDNNTMAGLTSLLSTNKSSGGNTDAGLSAISNVIPQSATPTPESAGIPNSNIMMNGKAESNPLLSVLPSSSNELILKK